MNNRQLVTGDASVAEFMPASVAHYNQVVPLRYVGETLLVGAVSPLTTETQERLQFFLNRRVRGVVRSAAYVAARLDQLYGKSPNGDGTDDVMWYWPQYCWLDDGNLTIKCTGWADGKHWTGCKEFPPDHPDHEMWRWIASVAQYRRLVQEKELIGIRRIWERYTERCRSS